MSLAAIAVWGCALAGVTQVWTESSLTDVFPDTARPVSAPESIRLYAARGEFESFQLCVRTLRRPLDEIRIEAGGVGRHIGPPEARRVAYLQTGSAGPRSIRDTELWPDPLLPFEPFPLPVEETAAVWITYHIPPQTPPGVYQARVDVRLGRRVRRRVPVTIEVFDFELPTRPGLATSLPLDRAAFTRDDPSLDGWRPVYDMLAPYRISPAIIGPDLIRSTDDGALDLDLLKEHLEYVAASAGLTTLNIGVADRGLPLSASPLVSAPRDPVRAYLREMADWLEARGLLDRAFVQPHPHAQRARWPQMRATLGRFGLAEARVRRLIAADPHPYFENSAEVWAVSLRYFDPTAAARLQEGYALSAPPQPPARAVRASSTGAPPQGGFHECPPEDAYDGCLATYWLSGVAPSARGAEWLEVELESPVRVNSLRVAWPHGHEPGRIRVRTARPEAALSTADVRWEHHLSSQPFDHSWSEGRFRIATGFDRIRLEFEDTREGGPVGVCAIEFDDGASPPPLERVPPCDVWLRHVPGDFPSFAANAHPVEARLFPWVCWGHNVDGLLGPWLNAWPEPWRRPNTPAPRVWTGDGGGGEGFLLYPGADGGAPRPSIRLERLRDGLEDYEYVAAMSGRAHETNADDLAAARWTRRYLFVADTTRDELDDLAARIGQARVDIGRALTRLAKGDRR